MTSVDRGQHSGYPPESVFPTSRSREVLMMTRCAHSTLPWFRGACVAVVLALVAATGCVERRFIIESNVPNALVYIDDNLVGAAPAHASFEYYGNYNITIIHPG